MLYPAKWKTVDQSKVLKNWLFRFWGATQYIYLSIFLTIFMHFFLTYVLSYFIFKFLL